MADDEDENKLYDTFEAAQENENKIADTLEDAMEDAQDAQQDRPAAQSGISKHQSQTVEDDASKASSGQIKNGVRYMAQYKEMDRMTISVQFGLIYKNKSNQLANNLSIGELPFTAREITRYDSEKKLQNQVSNAIDDVFGEPETGTSINEPGLHNEPISDEEILKWARHNYNTTEKALNALLNARQGYGGEDLPPKIRAHATNQETSREFIKRVEELLKEESLALQGDSGIDRIEGGGGGGSGGKISGLIDKESQPSDDEILTWARREGLGTHEAARLFQSFANPQDAKRSGKIPPNIVDALFADFEETGELNEGFYNRVLNLIDEKAGVDVSSNADLGGSGTMGEEYLGRDHGRGAKTAAKTGRMFSGMIEGTVDADFFKWAGAVAVVAVAFGLTFITFGMSIIYLGVAGVGALALFSGFKVEEGTGALVEESVVLPVWLYSSGSAILSVVGGEFGLSLAVMVFGSVSTSYFISTHPKTTEEGFETFVRSAVEVYIPSSGDAFLKHEWIMIVGLGVIIAPLYFFGGTVAFFYLYLSLLGPIALYWFLRDEYGDLLLEASRSGVNSVGGYASAGARTASKHGGRAASSARSRATSLTGGSGSSDGEAESTSELTQDERERMNPMEELRELDRELIGDTLQSSKEEQKPALATIWYDVRHELPNDETYERADELERVAINRASPPFSTNQWESLESAKQQFLKAADLTIEFTNLMEDLGVDHPRIAEIRRRVNQMKQEASQIQTQR